MMQQQTNEISDVSFESLTESAYLKPLRMRFTAKSKKRTWDMLITHDCVAALLYHTTKKAFVFVRQFRPAVYANRVMNEIEKGCRSPADIDWTQHPMTIGMTIELCAGIVDKAIPLDQVMQEEISEECGYHVPLENIKVITKLRHGIGTSGGLQTLYFAEIDDSMKIGIGGGNAIDGEDIEVVYMTPADAERMVLDGDVQRPAGLMFAVQWFIYVHAQKTQLQSCIDKVEID